LHFSGNGSINQVVETSALVHRRLRVLKAFPGAGARKNLADDVPGLVEPDVSARMIAQVCGKFRYL
jgi:hypothetical protein